MVKPIGSFEWGVTLVGAAVVTTIVALYAVGWDRAEIRSISPVTAEVKPATAAGRAPARDMTPPASTPPASTPPASTPPASTPPRKPTYVLTAARGDSWLLVRERSFRGRVLFEGVLPRGETLPVRAARLWIRFGAAGNVVLAVDGQNARLPSLGTFDAYVGPRGARADRTDYATAAQSP